MKHMWLMFVVGAVLMWGAYVPTIHEGQGGFSGPNRALRAFLFVGLAYFLLAVIVTGGLLLANPDNTGTTLRGAWVSTLAGVLGAGGALCVILALRYGGKPAYVAPLVFAGAPLMSVVVAMILHPPHSWPRPWFFLGLVLAAAGAALILRFKPQDAPKPAPAAVENAAEMVDNLGHDQRESPARRG